VPKSSSTPATAAPRPGTQSLRRAALLLRELSTRQSGGWTLTELATQCGLDRTTTHRMLEAMTREGLVHRPEGTRNYLLGPVVFELGLAAARRFDPRIACAAQLRRLRDRTSDTVFLNLRSGLDTVCFERLDGDAAPRALLVVVGARRTMVATAGGVAMIMAMPPLERRRVVRACLSALRRADAAHREGIARMLQRSEAAGYGLNCDDITPGISAVGVAILDERGTPFAAISVAATTKRLDERRCAKILDLIVPEAAKLRGKLAPSAGGAAPAEAV
jgi:DNA-binding IclR family transcriptional regulator